MCLFLDKIVGDEKTLLDEDEDEDDADVSSSHSSLCSPDILGILSSL